jgi:suppressor for copper-sensitivity B
LVSGELAVTVKADPALKKPDLFLERSDQMAFSSPKIEKSQGGKLVTFRVKPVENTGEGGLTDKPVVLTVVDGDRGMEVEADPSPPQPGIRFPRLLAMLGVALLGGLILNLMPCVLPVLSLKILALIGHGGGEKREVRSGFLATAAGIVISFLALAAVTSIVKLAGAAVGWGVQFQQPVFLGVMIALVTLFAANLFGWFEIPLPQFLAEIGASGGRNSRGWVGHFATGAFATLLATPCSAPFLGTAVGFALAHGVVEIFAIFLLLGIGMAAPYLLVAAWPQLAQKLPRPGNWMIVAKKILGLALLATGVWLVGVLVVIVGPPTALGVGAAMLVSLLLLALAHRKPAVPKGAVMAATLLAALGLTLYGPTQGAEDHKAAAKGLWKPFDRQAIAAEVAAGHIVFVDVTAEWCLTCQVNKATVVYRGEVLKKLSAPGVVAMQADWTRPDESIANYLASFGRYGIPFDVVYGPGAPEGVPLPELLTADAVLEALTQAAGKPKV